MANRSWLAAAAILLNVFSWTAEDSVRAGDTLRLRVLSWNIHHGEGVDGRLDLERIAAVIRSVSPDLVALQEVEDTTNRTGNVDQAAELGRLTDLTHVFQKNIDFQGGGYGNAILSRFPLGARHSIRLPRHNNGEQRGLLMVEVKVTERDKPLLFGSTHLDHRPDDSERKASAEVITHFVDTHNSNCMVLAGDLNAPPESAVLDLFRKSWTLSNSDPLPTIPVDKPNRQIDFILMRPAERWRVIETRVLNEDTASDHRAIFSVIELE